MRASFSRSPLFRPLSVCPGPPVRAKLDLRWSEGGEVKGWKRIVAIAALCAPAAAASTTVSIPYSGHFYQVGSWALECDGSTRNFDGCTAEKEIGAAHARIEAVTFAITAKVDTQCDPRRRVEGEAHEWPFEDFPYREAVDRIAADIDSARASCGQAPLAAREREELWEMVVLIYGLRPRPGD